MVKKKDQIKVCIETLQFPNKGIGNVEEYKVVVKNSLPGQVLSVQVAKKRNGVIEGRAVEVLEKSPLETETGCSHFPICGGCSYQTLSHEAELELKKEQVLELLQKAGVTGYEFLGIHSSPVVAGYRNKCEFSFGDEEKGGKLALGMRKRQSHYEVVTLTDCNIVDKDFITVIHSVLTFFQENNTPFYHKSTHEGVLRHLVVRKGAYTGEILLNLVTTDQIPFDLMAFTERLLSLPLQGSICGILHTVNTGVADVVKSEGTAVLYGKDYFMEKLFDLDFKVSAFSFFQTNTRGAEVLYSFVKDFAGDTAGKVIYDLYCGTGTISQIMAKGAKKVYGIELVLEAVEAAKENANRNQINNCTFLAGDVLAMVDELEEKPDLIIVDPPREGIHPKAILKIIAFGAEEIIYVSCKPTSLANDLKVFQENGYEVKKVALVDQFCRTVHVETCVLMSHKNS